MNLAILVGCDNHDDPEIASLFFAGEDARSLAAILEQFCGVSSGNMRLLPGRSGGGPASRSAIR